MKTFKIIPKDVKTIIFDWDGTLHESIHIYKPAFLKAYDYLVKNNFLTEYDWQDFEIASFLGMNPIEMWESFTPKLSNEVITNASSIISEEMLHLIKSNKARLYDGALDVLNELKKAGYYLVYLSNSKIYYMEAMIEAFKLDQYFDLFKCSEMYDYIPKPKILTHIKSSLPQNMLMIGDRKTDIDTGLENNAYTIGCLYGYGSNEELNHSDIQINSILDLIK